MVLCACWVVLVGAWEVGRIGVTWLVLGRSASMGRDIETALGSVAWCCWDSLLFLGVDGSSRALRCNWKGLWKWHEWVELLGLRIVPLVNHLSACWLWVSSAGFEETARVLAQGSHLALLALSVRIIVHYDLQQFGAELSVSVGGNGEGVGRIRRLLL